MKLVLKSFVVASLTFIAAAVVMAAPGMAGTWKVTGDVAGNAVIATLTLTQDGEAITGTADLEGADKSSAVTGTIKDRAVTLTFDIYHGGSTYANTWTGTLAEDGVLKGAIDVQGMASGEFTAKKQ